MNHPTPKIDWVQVELNGGRHACCFWVDIQGQCCGRHLNWAGHDLIHAAVSWSEFLRVNGGIPNQHPSEEIRHLLIKLGEECAEVTQAVSKALLFGLYDSYKDYGSNHDRIVHELHDILGVVKMLSDRKVLILPDPDEVVKLIEAKEVKVLKYMAYAQERGQL